MDDVEPMGGREERGGMLFLCNNHILRNRKTPSTILVDLAALCDGQQECHLGKLRSGMWDRCVLCVCDREERRKIGRGST